MATIHVVEKVRDKSELVTADDAARGLGARYFVAYCPKCSVTEACGRSHEARWRIEDHLRVCRVAS